MSVIKYQKVFEDALGYRFVDSSLLELAFTHPSYPFERRKKLKHNQRLEFLGDAVLQLAATGWLFDKYPEEQEGQLTKIRSSMVSKEALYHFATKLGIGERLLLGGAEEKNGGRTRMSNLADAFEAVLGAVYLDSNFDRAKEVVLKVFNDFPLLSSGNQGGLNPKGKLQEVLQAVFAESPKYTVVESSGPQHLPEYKVRVEWRGMILATGEGASKQKAEIAAARAALEAEIWEK